MYSGTRNCRLPEVCPVSIESQPTRFRKIVAFRCSGHWNISGEVITGTCMSKSGNCRKHEIWEQGKTQAEGTWESSTGCAHKMAGWGWQIEGKFYFLGLDLPSVSL